MKFNKHEKEIIRKIADGTVYDIPSYLKAFNLTTLKRLDKEAIENRLRAEEDGKLYEKIKDDVPRYVNSVTNIMGREVSLPIAALHTKEDAEYVPATIDYSGAEYKIEIQKDAPFVYKYFEGINCTNSFSDIKRFLSIWQYLKAENLVLEVNKEVTSADYEIFFEYKPFQETAYAYKLKEREEAIKKNSKNYVKIEYESTKHLAYDDPNRIKSFRNYCDNLFEYNKNREILCNQFLDKQIIGNADLDLFIRCKFHTYEQRSLFHSLLPAYLAMVLTLAITIYQEWDNNQDMAKIYDHLSIIEQQLQDTDNNLLSGPELERLEQQLNAILKKDFGSDSINDKLEELMGLIKNIKIPSNYSITIEADKN
jgi:hypothetical protein